MRKESSGGTQPSAFKDVSREEAENILLQRQKEREEKASMKYDSLFHPERTVLDSEVMIKEIVKKLIETPCLDPTKGRWDEKRQLEMYGEEKKETFRGLKHCAYVTGMPYHKIKGALLSKKTLFCEQWKIDVKFRFVYE